MEDKISAPVRRRFFEEFGSEAAEALSEAPWEIWLVGGAVRSLCWDMPVKDWDLLCDVGGKEKVRSLAEGLCRRLKAAFVVLDGQRGIYRAVDSRRRQLDFCAREGGSLQEDLNRRDFTVNSLAVCLNKELPVRGAEHACGDIESRILRSVSSEALREDPVRALRAWRFLAECKERAGLAPHAGLASQILRIRELIPSCAPERVWDELSRALRCPVLPMRDFLRESGLLSFFGERDLNDVYAIIGEFERAAEEKFSDLPESGRKLCDWFGSKIGKTDRTYISSFKLALLCGWNEACESALAEPPGARQDSPEDELNRALTSSFGARAEEQSSKLRLAVPEGKLAAELFETARGIFKLLAEEAGNRLWLPFLSAHCFFPAAAALCLALIKKAESDSLSSPRQGLICGRSKNISCVLRLCGYGKHLARLDMLLEDYLSGGPVSEPRLPIDGRGICLFLKIEPGPKVGELLRRLAAECAEKPLSRAEALKLLKVWNGE